MDITEQLEDGDFAFNNTHPYGTRSEPTYAGALSFLRRPYSRDLANADLAIMGVPFDLATSSRSGTRLGPRAIRSASSELAWARHWPWEFNPFDRLRAIDFGDCAFDPGRPEEVPPSIQAWAKHIIDSDTALLTLGGDHFITYPVLMAHAEKHGKGLSLLHFDAHCDTWPDEDGRVDHGTMFYHAAKDGTVDPSKSMQVGLRTTNDKNPGFNIIDGREANRLSPEEIGQRIKDTVGDNPVYLTFDIDCLDPAFAPGTGTPVCGGLSTSHALSILWELRGINIIGMDVVEVNPSYDHADITALAGATIALELICLYAYRNDKTPSK